jgi:type II secretion system protein I
MTPSPSSAKGFTLLEVILALAIFVGAIAVLSRLLVLSVENAEVSQWQAQAWLIAETQWAELESGVRSPSETGPFPVNELPGWEWSLEAETTEVSNLYRVHVIVRHQSQAGQPYVVRWTRFFFDDSAARQSEEGA